MIEACDGSYEASVKAKLNGGSGQNAIIYTCPDKLEEEVVRALSKSVLEDVRVQGSTLSGTIRADRDGELIITIPYDRNWRCYADGRQVEADCIGEALMGISLTEGEHEIRLSYMPDGMMPGLAVSLVCGVLIVLTFLYERKRRKKEVAMAGEKRLSEDVITAIMDIAGEDACLEEESMKKHTTFRIGGAAELFVSPGSEEALARVLDLCRRKRIPYYVTGNGSNLLVSDEGYHGVIVQIGKNLSSIRVLDHVIEAQAGAMLSVVAHKALEASLTGMEGVSGIPGTLGGALAMNAGAFGTEMKDITESVRVLDEEGQIRELSGEEMAFGYRTSAAQTHNLVILSARLVLEQGDREEIAERMEDLKERRQTKQPLDMPSAGSAFKRPEGHYAGALIEAAGLRGYREGGAQVSEKHCGFVVNTGGATAKDVRNLIRTVQDTVYENAGVRLEPEIRMLGFEETGGGPQPVTDEQTL